MRGEAWLVPDDGAPERLGPGDVAVLRGPDPYTFADDPGTPPQVVILPGQVCATPDGREITGMRDLGVRTWGNSSEGATVVLTGTYQMGGEVSDRLLRALPPRLVIRRRGLGLAARPAARRRDRHATSPARRRCSTGSSTCC